MRVDSAANAAGRDGPLTGAPNSLPAPAARRALEWPRQFGRDPPAIKTTGLWQDLGAVYAAIENVSVKSDAISQRLCPCQGVRIAPGDLRQLVLTIDQTPVFRRTFPLAKGAAACRTQKRTIDIGQWQIEGRRVRGLSYRPGGACSSHFEIPPAHHDLAHVTDQSRWAREIPYRYLSLGRDDCKWRTVRSSPAPLSAGLCQQVRFVACHRQILTGEARILCKVEQRPDRSPRLSPGSQRAQSDRPPAAASG